jgi:threonine dehydratase
MLSGTSLSVSHLLPNAAIYAAEPEGAADAVLSMKSGHVEKAPFIKTIADGLMTTMSERTLGISRPRIREVLLVSDDEIKTALKLVYERMKIVIEPSSATVLAAVLRNKELFKGKKVGVIITGGNVDLVKLSEWFG